MVYINAKEARQIENCNAMSHANYMNDFHSLKLSTGGAFFAGNEDFFSQVVGWGFQPLINEIEQIEAFYLNCGALNVGIEYSTLADLSVLNLLMTNGYQIEECNHVSVFDLNQQSIADNNGSEISIVVCTNEELITWAKVVARGFDCLDRINIFERYATTKGVVCFLALLNGELAGGAAMASHQSFADLGMSSTLNPFRGQGIQKALLAARLSFARAQKLSLASVITEAGSVSDNNVRKLGFVTSYSRLKVLKYF